MVAMKTIQNLQAVLVVMQIVQALGLMMIALEVSGLRRDVDAQAR